MVTAFLWLLAGCDPDPAPATDPVVVEVEEMSPERLLTRASLDLRGVRPSEAELAAVVADPSVFPDMVDTFLQDERFPVRVMSLFAEIYLTRTEYYPILVLGYGAEDDRALWSSVGDEPLQILGYIAANDLPYTEVVTGDWTMANERLAAVWPVDYPEGGEGWQKVHYTDERPAVGVLASNGLWWRYTSTQSNANRRRANALSRILLCNDYLSRDIDFDVEVNLLDEAAVSTALKSEPGCISCHASLDPLASYLYGFWTSAEESALEQTWYHGEREQDWTGVTQVPPAYYGTPGRSLWDLGRQIAADPGFLSCTVQQVSAGLLHRPVTLADNDVLLKHRNAFLAGDLTLRALYRSVVLENPAYRAAPDDAGDGVPMKMVSVDQLASQVEALTGFRWENDAEGMLATDVEGLRTLAGGADGYNSLVSASDPTATLTLVQERLAEVASFYAVDRELGLNADERTLLREVTIGEVPSDRAKLAQVNGLVVRVLSRSPSEEESAALVALWDELYAIEGDTGRAWAMLLSVILRDPDFLFY